MRPYVKFTISSAGATLLDYAVTLGLTELASLPYLLSSIAGLIAGGVLNYQINGHWVFHATRASSRHRVFSYVLCWGANLLVNTAGLYLLTEGFGIDYRISKIMTSAVIGSLFGFHAQSTLVFRGREHAEHP
ncbi:MAG: GtrA family protein [Bacteroidota bacterium]|jgi:putative flippase GtrA|nr:GtrA family protein [Bacteroidota bacterium]